MTSENKATVVTGQKISQWVGVITIIAAVILFIFDWLNGQIEWDYTLTAAASGLMCLYCSHLLKHRNEN